MNYRFVIRQLGQLLIVISLSLLGATVVEYLAWATGRVERLATMSLLISVVIGAAVGGGLWLIGRGGELERMGRREAMLLVALSWIIGAALSAAPFFIWAMINRHAIYDHPFTNPFACYFEAMSGLTTTGASVLHVEPSDIESLPKALLLWRSMTHWLGGLGIVVLFVAVLPGVGVGGKKLFQVEAPGPQQQGVRPRIRETARVLWLIYLTLTIICTLAYRVCGMDWFDALNHTFATLATGGFSTRNASIAAYDSWAIDGVAIVFMVLAGVNFGLYFKLVARRQWRPVTRDPELRMYLSIMLAASVIVCTSIVGREVITTAGEKFVAGPLDAVRYGVFQVVSIQTTTGFGTADFDLWSFLPKAVLVILMFIGGSAGSTGGGIKVIRVLVVAKIIVAEVERVFRPNVVRTVRVGQGTIDPDLRQGVLVYVLGIILLFVIGACAIKLAEPAGSITFITAATAAAATLNNIGPGLELVGPAANYGFFSSPALIIMSILMALGRLEVYAIAVLLLPRFWSGK